MREASMFQVAIERPVIGFDIGGVIRKTDRVSGAKVYRSGAVDAVSTLVRLFGPENSFIISRQKHDLWSDTTRWLEDQRFFLDTGFDPEHIHFCRERSEKAPIASLFGVTHFVDNRPEVFEPMREIVLYKYLFKPKQADLEVPRRLGEARIVWNWPDTVALIESSLRRNRRLTR